jgi:hypothetical protein
MRNPSLRERTKTVLDLTTKLRLIEAGIMIFEGVNSNKQRATTWQGIFRMLAWYEQILMEK